MGRINAICISKEKGTPKQEVSEVVLEADYGISGDAHAGKWHRQVSLLSADKIREFAEGGPQNPGNADPASGIEILPGAFGENLIVEGIDLRRLPVGTRFLIGDVMLELTQIGKECHDHCAIYKAMGDCIMPREGVFTRVLCGGTIHKGDEIIVINPDENRAFCAAVITLSDKGAAGEREDKSGPAAEQMLTEAGYEVIESLLLPDDRGRLEEELIRLTDQRGPDVIFTSGGTGFSERDITPDATEAVCDRMANGIAEAIRAYSMSITPRAMFSRAVSGIRKKTLIINLPGSPKAVQEALGFLLPQLDHGIGILRGTEHECARTDDD